MLASYHFSSEAVHVNPCLQLVLSIGLFH